MAEYYDLSKLKTVKDEKSKEVSDVATNILTPDKKRENTEKNHFHWLKICLIWMFGILIVWIAFTVTYHLVMPISSRWLTTEEVASLEKMFVTGIGAALIGKFGNKLVD